MDDYSHLKGHSNAGEAEALIKKETSPEEAKKLL
jgi:hypothetical protein